MITVRNLNLNDGSRQYVQIIFQLITLCLVNFVPTKGHLTNLNQHSTGHLWSVKIRQGSGHASLGKETLEEMADKLARDTGLKNFGQIGELVGYYLYNANNNGGQAMELLANHDNVEWCKEEIVLKRTKREVAETGQLPVFDYKNFKDPLYYRQWHLLNDQNGLDCNVTGVWEHGITGKGIVVAVVDDGVQWKHPDLLDNYCEEGSFDLNSNDNDPSPKFDKDEENKHGTRCAGEIAAVPNSVCGVGIAYGAKFSGIRVLDGLTTDSNEATAFNKHMDVNDVYSCSWGPEDDGETVDGPHSLGLTALQHGVVAGRSGFGSIFVVASGNGGENKDNCNYDGYANSIYTITVGAVDEFGNKPTYAEECTSMFACSVSSGSGFSRSIVTTDWTLHHKNDPENACTSSHTGTSAATPLVAGMVALMLEVRPCLSWRDIQHIMAMTASKIDRRSKWVRNKAGFQHSDSHGFGLLSAWRLVNAAKVWEPVPWLTSFTPDTSHDRSITIPADGSRPVVLKAEVTEEDCKSHLLSTLEYILFTVTLTHHTRGQLKYVLQCPSGTESVIPVRPNDASKDGLTDWSFSSVKCWGENPIGTYSLKIFDKTRKVPQDAELGVVKEWKLTVYGSQWTSASMRKRRTFINSAMSGDYLSGEKNFSVYCPPGQSLQFDVTTALSDRTVKLVAMLSCFLVFWAMYYSVEMAFCNAEDKEKEAGDEQRQTEGAASRTSNGQESYGASSNTYAQEFSNSAFLGADTIDLEMGNAELTYVDTGQDEPAVLETSPAGLRAPATEEPEDCVLLTEAIESHKINERLVKCDDVT